MKEKLCEKESRAIQYIKNFQPTTEPYYLCYSGGKDSDTIRILADLAGVNYECHNNHTTVDDPETVYYIREVMQKYGEKKHIKTDDGEILDVYGDKGYIHYPKKTMWELIEDKGMPPTRLVRYCCKELKEGGGKGRVKITGVRWAESNNRRDNQGRVTIIGKPKQVMQNAFDNRANFFRTDRGGWC